MLGSTMADAFYIGTTQINKIYLGSTLIYENNNVTEEETDLFDESAVSVGLLQKNGSIYNSTSWRCSNYIPVEEGTYLFSWESDSNYFQINYATYDENKTLLNYTSVSKWGIYEKEITIDSNVKYLRISYSVAVSGSEVTRENIKLVKV